MINLKENKYKRYIIKSVLLFIIIAIFTVLTIKYAPLFAKLANPNYRVAFKDEINQMGFKGVFIVLGLQILQTIVAILPGQPIEILSGMLYGPIWGTVICVLGIFISVTIIFFFVRRYGVEFIKLFFSEEKIKKIENSKLFNSSKFEMVLFMIFFLPFFPKDIFIYIAGLSPIKPLKFLAIATLGRIPGQWLGVYAGSKLLQGSYMTPIIVFIIFGILGLLFIKYVNKFHIDKDEFKDLLK